MASLFYRFELMFSIPRMKEQLARVCIHVDSFFTGADFGAFALGQLSAEAIKRYKITLDILTGRACDVESYSRRLAPLAVSC